MKLSLGVRFILAFMAFLCGVNAARAHEVRDEVTVYTFLKPEGRTLTFLVRAPLASLRDIDVPTRPDGFLDLANVDQALRFAAELWITTQVTLYADGVPLDDPRIVGARISLPSDRSFASYESALAGITGQPLPLATEITWDEGFLDVAYAYPIRADSAQFAIEPGLTRLGLSVNVVIRFLAAGAPERAFDVHADVGKVELDPSFTQAFVLFAEDGFFRILGGVDHLLFLFVLVLPFRRLRPLVVIVTAFTVGHSITLVSAALGLAPDALWFPYLIEALIAVSILFMALENIVGANLGRRWWLAFGFGLVHGFGFSFLLGERLQFAGSHLVAALLAFNVGVELGQLLVLLVLLAGLALAFRHVVAERIGIVVASALVAHASWHWMTERGSALMQFPLPTLDAVAVGTALWWAMAAVAAAALTWLVSGLVRRWQGERKVPPGDAPTEAAE